MGDSRGMLIMFAIMMGGYFVIYGIYKLYHLIHSWLLRRKNR